MWDNYDEIVYYIPSTWNKYILALKIDLSYTTEKASAENLTSVILIQFCFLVIRGECWQYWHQPGCKQENNAPSNCSVFQSFNDCFRVYGHAISIRCTISYVMLYIRFCSAEKMKATRFLSRLQRCGSPSRLKEYVWIGLMFWLCLHLFLNLWICFLYWSTTTFEYSFKTMLQNVWWTNTERTTPKIKWWEI